MNINILRLIGIMLIGISIFIYGLEKGSVGIRLIGTGVALSSFGWSIE